MMGAHKRTCTNREKPSAFRLPQHSIAESNQKLCCQYLSVVPLQTGTGAFDRPKESEIMRSNVLQPLEDDRPGTLDPCDTASSSPLHTLAS